MCCHQCGAKAKGNYCSAPQRELIATDTDLETLPQDRPNVERQATLNP